MKTAGCLVAGVVAMAGCALLAVIALYVAGGLAASQSARGIPVVGNMVGDRIEQWVLGGEESLVADEMPWEVIEVGPGGVVTWTEGIEWGENCETPRGLPAAGPVKWFFREPRYPSHTGIDISVATGTPVHATMCGVVMYAGWSDVGYGYLVVIQNGEYQTYYAHNSVVLVSVGDTVEAGQMIAESGSTGNSTGPHVHYEVRVRGVPIDPCETAACF